ncbi:hypothetical protein [Sphingobacterium thalpophilum]|uniref:hypothetical protein n=1 Tax=Sphingobacterium thalpophilum TaxID=259 RepID=UPI0024A6924D|nr:hypothetical protein [Sphingobacterium thalpophilum]
MKAFIGIGQIKEDKLLMSATTIVAAMIGTIVSDLNLHTTALFGCAKQSCGICHVPSRSPAKIYRVPNVFLSYCT